MKNDQVDREDLLSKLDQLGTEPCLCGTWDGELSCPNCSLMEAVRREIQALFRERDQLRNENERLHGSLQDVCDMQAANYGHGTKTHLALIGLCENIRRELKENHYV